MSQGKKLVCELCHGDCLVAKSDGTGYWCCDCDGVVTVIVLEWRDGYYQDSGHRVGGKEGRA